MDRRFAHGGNVYDAAPGGKEWLDFSANINPLGLSTEVRRAIENGIGNLVHYPDPAARELKQAIAGRYGIPRENIVLGNGGAELFYVYFHAARPKRVLLPIPSFSEYERAAISAGAEIAYVALREEADFCIDECALSAQLAMGDCLILGTPNNPTGQMVKAAALQRIVAEAGHKGANVVVDESFMDFRSDAEDYTVRALVASYDNLLVVQSLTKFFAIPGLRLGFAVAPKNMTDKLEAAKDPWNTNLLAQAAGVAALRDRAYQERTLQWLWKEREFLFQSLSALEDIKAYPPTVNFILLRLSPSWGSASAFCERMRAEGILLRNCSNYPGLDDTFVRVAVRNREDNERLLRAFRHMKEEHE
ncbi:MAG: threonine-phosphate decarboxylase [Schwartzia sp.]|nr:threonine-phosphate decarboxylase [Schwartzia sp. (in: firmicutes)]